MFKVNSLNYKSVYRNDMLSVGKKVNNIYYFSNIHFNIYIVSLIIDS